MGVEYGHKFVGFGARLGSVGTTAVAAAARFVS